MDIASWIGQKDTLFTLTSKEDWSSYYFLDNKVRNLPSRRKCRKEIDKGASSTNTVHYPGLSGRYETGPGEEIIREAMKTPTADGRTQTQVRGWNPRLHDCAPLTQLPQPKQIRCGLCIRLCLRASPCAVLHGIAD